MTVQVLTAVSIDTDFFSLRRVVSRKLTGISQYLPASIIAAVMTYCTISPLAAVRSVTAPGLHLTALSKDVQVHQLSVRPELATRVEYSLLHSNFTCCFE
jgi:hypothetical protein